VEDAISRSVPPDDVVIKLARDYARRVRGLPAAKEKTFWPVFIDEVLIKILGYSRIDPDTPYSLRTSTPWERARSTPRSGTSKSQGMSKKSPRPSN
jgi:hypothetical protein